MATTKPFYKGTNFWLASLMFIGSYFSLSAGVAEQIVLTGATAVAALGGAREWLKREAAVRTFKDWISDKNTWNYVAGVTAGIAPALVEIVEPLRGVVDAVVLKDWGALAQRIFSFATIVYYLLLRR